LEVIEAIFKWASFIIWLPHTQNVTLFFFQKVTISGSFILLKAKLKYLLRNEYIVHSQQDVSMQN